MKLDLMQQTRIRQTDCLKSAVRSLIITRAPAPDMGIWGLLTESNFLLLTENGVALQP